MKRAWALAMPLALVGAADVASQQHREQVTVSRILLDVRALDGSGRPLPGLTASSFEVTVDGQAAKVESAQWMDAGGSTTTASVSAADGIDGATTAPAPRDMAQRTIVLVQRKHDLSDVVGLMGLSSDLARLADTVRGGSRMAVLSFDSEPHVWASFTADREQLRRTLRSLPSARRPRGIALADVVGGVQRVLWASPPPALASLEASLESLGQVLASVPGPKTILIVGFGLGTWDPRTGIVAHGPAYDRAIDALRKGRVSVFCIDTTAAEYHPQQEGLIQLSLDSGGLYWSSREFTSRPLEEFMQATSGYYLVSVVPPDQRPGRRSIAVTLAGRRGRILTKSTFSSE